MYLHCLFFQVKEFKNATIQRLASFESQDGHDQVKLKRKQPKFCRSTSENVHEYRNKHQLLTTLVVDDTHLGLEKFNAHKMDCDTHLHRRIVSTSEGKSTTEDIFRRSTSSVDSLNVAEKATKSDKATHKETKANLVEDEEVEKGSVRQTQAKF